MIKTNNGNTSITGSKAEIYADFATVTYALILAMREKEIPDEKIEKFLRSAFEEGLKGDDVLKNIDDKKVDMKKLSDLLDQLIDVLGGEVEDWKKEEG